MDTCIAIMILSFGIRENYVDTSKYYHTYSLQLFELIYFYYFGIAFQLMTNICQIAASFNIYRMLSGKFKIFDKLSCKIVILMAFIFSFGYFSHLPLTTQILHENSMIYYSFDEIEMPFLDDFLNASKSDDSYYLKFDLIYELIDSFIWGTITLVFIVQLILLKIAMRKTSAKNISVSSEPPRNLNELVLARGTSDENSMAQALFAMNILASIGVVLRLFTILKHHTMPSESDTCLIGLVHFILEISYVINFIFYTMYMLNFLKSLLSLIKCCRKNGSDYASLPESNPLNLLPQSSQL